MRTVLFLFGLVVSLSASSQTINWMTMNEALEAQKETPKKIIMDVYTTWCGPCKIMDENTFGNDDVIDFIQRNYYAVKFNAEGTEEIYYNDFNYTNPNHNPERKGRNSQHLFAHALNINAYPSLVFFDEGGEVITPIAGYRSPTDLEIYLKMVSNDDYKRLTTKDAWTEYQANFENTFTN